MKKLEQVLTAKICVDLFLTITASFLAFWIRLDGTVMSYLPSIRIYMTGSVIIKVFLLLNFKTHKQFWRHSSMEDLLDLIKICGIFVMLQSTLFFLLGSNMKIPRSIPILDGITMLVLMGSLRMVWRLYNERDHYFGKRGNLKNILIVGAGDAGTMIAKEMLKHPESGMVPVGYLDDDVSKHKLNIMGLPVFGPIDDLPNMVKGRNINEILIALPSVSGDITRRIVDLAQGPKIPYRIMPGLHELVSGKVKISSIRNVEVEDLLKRDPVSLDIEDIAGYLNNKVVMITGAGGSIGSEIVRQVARFNPKRIILLGRGENSLFNIENKLKKNSPETPFSTVVCDVRYKEKVKKVFLNYKPQVVFHAAAHKHVPMMETNADEAILNNVGGTKNLVELSLEYKVQHFVNISTDKAVNPTSIMGASKRTSEMIVRKGAALAREGQSFISVRFGNVLGSRGSVIPMFKEQIINGGPVTVTHPDMTRYFMTIPEAAQLVLQAGGMNGNGTVYVLDMGEPVKIIDLAKDLIRLSGFEPHVDIEIIYSGIRPGEKLYEELLTAEEGTQATKHDKIFFAKSPPLPSQLDDRLEELFQSAHRGNKLCICKAFEKLIPRCDFECMKNVSLVDSKDKEQFKTITEIESRSEIL